MALRLKGGLTRRDVWFSVATLACVISVLAMVGWMALKRPNALVGDSAVVARSSADAVECLRRAHFVHCNGTFIGPDNEKAAIGPFPLLQFAPAIALRAAGVSAEATFRVFILLSFVSLGAILVLAFVSLRRVAASLWAPLVTASLVASPLLWYGRSPFGEELAAAVILGAIVAVLLDANLLLVGTLVAWACLTKETNPPFVFALAAICALGREHATPRYRRQQMCAIALGTAAGIALNAAFDIFRYGTLTNSVYLSPAYQTTRVPVVSRLFLAQWFAPNGGIMWFWPLAPVLIISVALLTIKRAPYLVKRMAALIAALLFLAQIALLSMWWEPFGWLAWGPRLILPLLPAMIVTACAVAAPYVTGEVARFVRSRAFFAAGLIVIGIGLAQATVLFYSAAVARFFKPGPTFCRLAEHKGYYNCLVKTAWSKQPWMLQLGLRGLGSTQGRFVAVAFVGAMACLLAVARSAATRETETCEAVAS